MNDQANPSTSTYAKNRRQFVRGIVIGLAALAASAKGRTQPQQLPGNGTPGNAPNPRRTSLHYQAEFKVGPQRVYEALLDSKQFAAFTGLPAEIDAKEGGAFSLFGGQIVGRNIELVPSQRIVQAWRPASWTPGIYSVVRFELKPIGSGSTLLLDQTGFPEGDADSLDSGWHMHYLDTLRKYLS
jgi:activator of HSP90 ATPase